MKIVSILSCHGGAGVAYAVTGLAAAAASDGRNVGVIDLSPMGHTAARLMHGHISIADAMNSSPRERLRHACRRHSTMRSVVQGQRRPALELQPTDGNPVVVIPPGAALETIVGTGTGEIADNIQTDIQRLAAETGIDTILIAGHRGAPEGLLDELIGISDVVATIGDTNRSLDQRLAIGKRLDQPTTPMIGHIRNRVPVRYKGSCYAEKNHPVLDTILYEREAARQCVSALYRHPRIAATDSIAGVEDDCLALWYELDTVVTN